MKDTGFPVRKRCLVGGMIKRIMNYYGITYQHFVGLKNICILVPAVKAVNLFGVE